MAGEPISQGLGHPSAPGSSPIVFVTDASAEAERIADTLRVAGYVVADVPRAMLSARVAAQHPNVVLVDIDADGILGDLARIRRLPGSGAIDFVYLGSGIGPVKNADEALSADGAAFFLRPVDIGGLVRKIDALTGGPVPRPLVRPSTPPPSIPAGRYGGGPTSGREPGSDRPSMPSLPAPGLRTPGPPLPMSTTSLADFVDPPRALAPFGSVSHELQQLLADAEYRAEVASSSSAEIPLPSPEEELEAVLPADVLALLDEPLEGDEDDVIHDVRNHETSSGREGREGHARATTSGGTRQSTTGAGSSTGASTGGRAITSAPPSLAARRTQELGTIERYERAEPAPTSMRTEPPARPSSWLPPPMATPAAPPVEVRGPSLQPASEVGAPAVVLGRNDARRFFADAITRRATGSLCYEQEGVVRRVVMRDGDLVAAASADERESLVQFLGASGELPRDEVERLISKVPPYGRHAGAALVAHGWLGQDQLWRVLRAHAEWIASRILLLSGGTAQLEPEPPGRLRSEPSVFGASTGPEVFVELVRRAVTPEEALSVLGGEGSRLTDGANQSLYAECNVPPQDLELLARVRGGTIGDLLARAPDAEIVSVVHALALLGVIEVVPAPDFTRGAARRERDRGPTGVDADALAIDEDAVRARVRARGELVDEGDYFAVLGVSRDATSYEIRRAYLELRRTFEPSKILTPRLRDLESEVRKIVVVLDEAYEILRDAARRERYRRAIEARPE
ncbi:large Ala/Glu-rich protein [Labilithrix luteola]|uniref:Large Ala/Glu-rich protein n=1 Tax=Labilithrix luteola TaxID=1391654 RepID=A0A0K1PUR1_9BACT|nr:DnaJ domain-containing protein [Labilithrix luteola]AKU97265.1 large Ala/Glu-rich protein [Labilithrix luteola]